VIALIDEAAANERVLRHLGVPTNIPAPRPARAACRRTPDRGASVVNDEVGGQPIVLVLAPDSASFFAYRRPDRDTHVALVAGRLMAADRSYTLGGRGESDSLTPVFASQEFWHSWRSFHSDTDTR